MNLDSLEEDKMCTEEDIRRINKHTDEVGEKMHLDSQQLIAHVHSLDKKFTAEIVSVRHDFKEDLREVFGQLREIRKSVSSATWTSASVTCSLIVVLFGLLFNWLWGQEQLRDNQINTMSAVLGSSVATDESLRNEVQLIRQLIEKETGKNTQKIEKELEKHLKYNHEKE